MQALQQPVTAREPALRWPWGADDLAPTEEEMRRAPRPIWRRAPLWMIIVWLVGVIVFVSLGVMTDERLYQHNLATQSSWIAQQSQQEATCLSRATTDAQRTACARALATAVTLQQAQFDQSRVAWGQHDSAGQMHSAFDALYAAACYDPASDTADMGCLAGTAPALRLWAQQDAQSAQGQ